MAKHATIFSTCPKASVMSTDVEYKIMTESLRELLIIKNQISFVDVQKAAKCAGLKQFSVRRVGETRILSASDFPVKCNLVVMKPAVTQPTPTMITPKKFKIIKAVDNSELAIIEGAITLAHVEKAAKCAGFKKFSTYLNRNGTPFAMNSGSRITHDIYLRQANIVSTKTATKSLKLSKEKQFEVVMASFAKEMKKIFF